MKRKSFTVTKFWNAELVSLGDDTLRICKTFDWASSPTHALFENVESSLTELKEQINKESTVNETQEIYESDDLFNNSWRAARYYNKAFLLSSDAEESKAAKVMLDLAKLYGVNLHLESYAVQNANARLYLNDCESKDEVKAAIAKIQLQPFVDRIKLHLENLEKAIEVRAQKASEEYRDEETKVYRKNLYNNLINLYKYLEVMSTIDANGEFANMLKLINESIRKLNGSVARRYRQVEEEVQE